MYEATAALRLRQAVNLKGCGLASSSPIGVHATGWRNPIFSPHAIGDDYHPAYFTTMVDWVVMRFAARDR